MWPWQPPLRAWRPPGQPPFWLSECSGGPKPWTRRGHAGSHSRLAQGRGSDSGPVSPMPPSPVGVARPAAPPPEPRLPHDSGRPPWADPASLREEGVVRTHLWGSSIWSVDIYSEKFLFQTLASSRPPREKCGRPLGAGGGPWETPGLGPSVGPPPAGSDESPRRSGHKRSPWVMGHGREPPSQARPAYQEWRISVTGHPWVRNVFSACHGPPRPQPKPRAAHPCALLSSGQVQGIGRPLGPAGLTLISGQ